MAVVKNLMIRAGADFSQLEKELKKAQKTLKNAGRELTQIGKTMTMGITAPIVGAGAAAFKMAADMEDALGATDQIFKGSSDGMKNWAKNLESYYGIASGEALEYGNMMGSMLQNIGGLTEDEAAKQSQTLIKLAGDLTAMYGGSTEDAVRALTGALKGNNTMLDNYGMAVNDAMIKTKAFEMGIYSGKGEMSLATKQAATLALIMEQTGAAQGQASREAEGASGTMRAFTTEIKNLATTIGETLLPIITPMIQKISEGVKWFGGLDEGTKKNILTALGLAAVLGPLLLIFGQVATVIATLVGVYLKFNVALTAGKTIFAAFGAALGPTGLIMIGLMALAAAAYLIITNWDKVKAFFIGFKDHWVGIFNSIGEFTKGIMDGIVSFIKGGVNKVIDALNGMIRALNKLKINFPDWIPKLGGKSFGLNIPAIPKLADGGIATKPTLAMIGEAGPEAVVPLRDGMRNTTQTINLTVELDGKVLARQLFNPLENEKRVRGRVLAGGTV